MKKTSPDPKSQLVEIAKNAQKWAYTPYSHYPVGAAVLTESGKIYDGVNVENAAYPVTMCAERVAIFKAVSAGERMLSAIAVVTKNGGTPCGSCRQVMVEFNPDMIVLVADEEGHIIEEKPVKELLPGYFSPEYLKK